VLDVGSSAGFDVLLAVQAVGPEDASSAWTPLDVPPDAGLTPFP
jgi:hypothetical protein